MSRRAARDALVAILTANLTGSGKPVQAVLPGQVTNFQGQSPVVTVYSGPADRARASFGGYRSSFTLQADVFVLYTDDAGWSEQDVENALDAIEQAIADVVDANARTADWQSIAYGAPSTTATVLIDGKEYRRETISLVIEVY